MQCETIIEEPTTPKPQCLDSLESAIEDAFWTEDPDEIPMIKLNIKEFMQNIQNYMQEKGELQDVDMSKALVALTQEAATIPMPKLKNINCLRTEHQVYELPDTHPLLAKLDRREPDDKCAYLLAIWTPEPSKLPLETKRSFAETQLQREARTTSDWQKSIQKRDEYQFHLEMYRLSILKLGAALLTHPKHISGSFCILLWDDSKSSKPSLTIWSLELYDG
ncbi:hypothetical protein AAC387_Pa09g1039 [Persea americana]